jgi:hypothetical protein
MSRGSSKDALAALKTLLHREWDPIGGVPEDAYDSYARQTFGRLTHGAAVEEIAAYLDEVEGVQLGLSVTPQSVARNREVAAMAAALVDAARHPPARKAR